MKVGKNTVKDGVNNMTWILEVLGSAGFGSVIGGIFGYLTKREERENMKMKFDHEVNMIQAKTNASVQIAQMGIEEAKAAGELLVEKIEAKAFDQSQKETSEAASFIKALIRPVILALLMYQTYMILASLEELSGGLNNLPVEDIISLYKVVILSVTGLTATAVGWYFAARSSKQFDKLMDKWNV